MKKRIISSFMRSWFLLFFLTLSSGAIAQQDLLTPFCQTDELNQQALSDNPGLNDKIQEYNDAIRTYQLNNFANPSILAPAAAGGGGNGTANFIVPVVVYIVEGNVFTGAVNITDPQVTSQINRLNTEFSPHGIQFCLATTEGNNTLPGAGPNPGIIRLQNSTLSDLDVGTEDASLKALSSLPSSKYLRIFVVDDIDNTPGFKGYSTSLPWSSGPALEGIVMRYDAFGDNANCANCYPLDPANDEGKVLVHEVGHYFNLYHIFQGGCAGGTTANCNTAGDYVCDTPPAAQHTGCPSANSLNTCILPANTFDLLDNHMDYLDDVCRTSFTPEQGTRMICAINLFRSTLVSGANLAYTGIQCAGGLLASFTLDNYIPCVNDPIVFTAISQQGVTYSWDFGDNSPIVTGPSASASHAYATGGTAYIVTLTVSDGSNTISESQQIFVTDCNPINSSQGNWYFYDGAGLQFGSGTPTADDAAWNTSIDESIHGYHEQEACAVQSDFNGNLLFYTDNVHVWDEGHTLINLNNDLAGSHSTAGGTIILPDPGSPSEYYIFTNSTFGQPNYNQGFRYSKVQVNGTAASMTGTINQPVIAPASPAFQTANNNAIRFGEGITAVASCDGYWIIGNARRITTQPNGNVLNYYYLVVYELTAAGVSYHSSWVDPSFANKEYSVLKASPDGTKLVRAVFNSPVDGTYLYDFDPATGIITNQVTLNTIPHAYGISFSPSSSLVYAASPYAGLFQYDATAANPASTEVMVSPPNGLYALQIAPDQKIYGVRWDEQELAVIHQPDVPCSANSPNACIFNANGPNLNTALSGTDIIGKWGLPNMVDAHTNGVFSKSISCSPISCLTYQFSVAICGTNYTWNFGDPASGGGNTSTLASPIHTFTGPGTYIVTVNVDGSTFTKTVVIGIGTITVSGLTSCLQTGTTYNYSSSGAPAGATYSWTASNGTITGLNGLNNINVNWTSFPGTLTLVVTDPVTGCSETTVTTVTNVCPCDVRPGFNVSIGAQNGCLHYFNDFSSVGAGCTIQNWSWDFGDVNSGSNSSSLQSPSHIFSGNGTYNVCLTVTAICNGQVCTETVCQTVFVNNCNPCACGLLPNFSFETNKCSVDFRDLSTVINKCTEITNWSWNFGDPNSGSNSSALQSPSHTFLANGTYTVCLTIYGNNGIEECYETVCFQVVIEDCKLCTSCDLNPNFLMEIGGCVAYFSDVSTTPFKCVQITNWSWDFGDPTSGAFNTSTQQNPTHTFSASGTYTVCLTIYGNNGFIACVETICYDVVITDCNNDCPCDITANAAYELGRCTASFANLSTSNSCTQITNVSWDFGDPTSGSANNSTQPNPNHSYSVNGTYTVCLTVYGNNGDIACVDTYCFEIVITDCKDLCTDCQLSPNYYYELNQCTAYFGNASTSGHCTQITNWIWDFGDPASGSSNTSNQQSPSHTFSGNGTYTVCLTIQGNNGMISCTQTICYQIEVTNCDPCTDCELVPNFYTEIGECTAYFSNASQAGNCTQITGWSWDFGDPASGVSNTSNAQHPTHTYSANGIYTVCLTVFGNNGNIACVETFCYEVVITNCGPCTDCDLAPSFYMEIGECTAYFSNASQAGNCTQITGWSWDFGDPSSGTSNTSNAQHPTHTYSANGIYTVCLTVFGNNGNIGCVETVCYQVVITNCDPCTDCELAPNFYTEIGECTAYFSNASQAGNCTQITGWSWDFGDPASGSSNTSTVQNPTHTYSGNGTYTVCLTVFGNNGNIACVETICYQVVITGCDPCTDCDLTPNFYTEIGQCTAYFSNASQAGNCTQITGWSWNFGDSASGASNTSTAQHPTHTYSGNGIYTVCLTVFGNNGNIGCVQTVCSQVTITNCESECDECDMSPAIELISEDYCNYELIGSNNGTSCPSQQYRWDIYSSGFLINSLSGQNSGYTFPANGTYTLCLTIYVLDNNGDVMCEEHVCREVYASCNKGFSRAKVNALPNPASTKVIFSLDNDPVEDEVGEIVVYDTKGKVLHKGSISSSLNNELDISSFVPGVYYYHVNFAEGKSKTEKLIVFH